MPLPDVDVLVIGGGIVGVSAARELQLRDPAISVLVIEKEAAPALHQTGRNSGVVHSGVYYAPGSAKAHLVREGRRRLIDYAVERNLPMRRCGKVIVASTDAELPRLAALEQRAASNGIATRRVDVHGLRDVEPHATGVGALVVPDVWVTDFGTITESLVGEIRQSGGELRTGAEVTAVRADTDGVEVVLGDDTRIRARCLVNCAGLHSDKVARLAGIDPGLRIMPFRGEYLRVIGASADLVRGLVYPLPDPAYPFLGVHLTRMVDGSVHAGPNAVPALAREGYSWTNVSRAELSAMLSDPASRQLVRRYWRTGAAEVRRSLSIRRFTDAARRLVPGLAVADLVPDQAGVRAQALRADGRLLDDFAFADGPRSVHVLNAPSPAATASPAIASVIADRAFALLGVPVRQQGGMR